MNYAFAGALVLEQRKPYSFAPYLGLDFLDAYARSRLHLLALLTSELKPGPAAPPLSTASRVVALRRFRLDTEAQLLATGQLQTAQFLEQALFAAAAPELLYRPEIDEDAWLLTQLDLLLRRFEAYGRVFDRYDANWRRIATIENTPALICRLSVAAAWLATSMQGLDAAACQCYANVLLKLNDLAGAGVTSDLWHLAERERSLLASALQLEQSLVRSLGQRAKERS